MPAAEAPTTSTSHFISIGKTLYQMNLSGRALVLIKFIADEIQRDQSGDEK
jgi:hypothetical protein